MNSPAAFTMVMTKILSGLLFKSALAYIDDVLVYSSSFEQHLKHLELIFDRFRKAGIKFKPSKCVFAKKSVTYLGHILTNEEISIHKDKASVIRDYQRPKTQKQVRQFLGCVQYYKRFIKDFSHKAVELNKLLKKILFSDGQKNVSLLFNRLKILCYQVTFWFILISQKSSFCTLMLQITVLATFWVKKMTKVGKESSHMGGEL